MVNKILTPEEQYKERMIDLLISCQATCEEHKTGKVQCSNCSWNPMKD